MAVAYAASARLLRRDAVENYGIRAVDIAIHQRHYKLREESERYCFYDKRRLM